MASTRAERDRDAEVIRVASRKAIESAIRLHQGLELPMAVWKDGVPTWVSPKEAERMLLTPERGTPNEFDG
jgi:hypothetical protein